MFLLYLQLRPAVHITFSVETCSIHTLCLQLRPAMYVVLSVETCSICCFFFFSLLPAQSLTQLCKLDLTLFLTVIFFSLPSIWSWGQHWLHAHILLFIFDFCHSLPYSIPSFLPFFLPKLGSLTFSVFLSCHPHCRHIFFLIWEVFCVFSLSFCFVLFSLYHCSSCVCLTPVFVKNWYKIRLYLLLLSSVCLPWEAKMLFITISVIWCCSVWYLFIFVVLLFVCLLASCLIVCYWVAVRFQPVLKSL